jgi:hypothetical protein
MTERRDETALAEKLAEITDHLVAGEPVGAVEEGEMAALVETVAKLRAAMVTAQPSAEFAARLCEQALAALPAPETAISERLREVINRLLRDQDFRQGFLASPEAALQRAGIQLSSAEMAALKKMEPDDLKEWMADLDERISKSGLPW